MPPILTRTIPEVNEARRGEDDTDTPEAVNINSPQLDALLNALDDTDSEQSLGAVISHCASAAELLDESEKQQLRGKIRTTKVRIAAQEEKHEEKDAEATQTDTPASDVVVLGRGKQGEKTAAQS